MTNILIIGATSAIAEATARLFAAQGDKLYLVARRHERLQAVADDLRARGAGQVECEVLDVMEYNRHATVITNAHARLGGLDIALVAHGTLPIQSQCEASFETARQEFEINCLSTLSFLTHLANFFEAQGNGTIAVITSVAADRGRQSNYTYGATKAAVTAFLSGLRSRLHKANVHVLTIKPGFVDTPMTSDFDKGLLWTTPERVASGIYRGIAKKADIIYLPFFWRWIMLVIRLIPERVFKRLAL